MEGPFLASAASCSFLLCLRRQNKANGSYLGAQTLPSSGPGWYTQELEENDLGGTLPLVLKKTLLSADVCSLEPMT